MAVTTPRLDAQKLRVVRMREKLGLRPGSKIVFEEQPGGSFVVRKKTGDIRELKGLLKAPPGKVATIEDMDQAVTDAMAEKLARSR